MMLNIIIQFFTLFLLMLVTGIFFGPWFSLHRSMKVFSAGEFIHIVKTMSANLAMPMRFIMPACILLLLLSTWLYPQKNSLGFCLSIISLSLTFISLLITILVEVPIVKQIEQWTPALIPSNWHAVQNRWLKFHVIRMLASLVSFACFTLSLLL